MAITRKDFYVDSKDIKLLTDALSRIPKYMPGLLEKAIYEEANVIFKESQLIVPVDTGALRKVKIQSISPICLHIKHLSYFYQHNQIEFQSSLSLILSN